MKEHWVIPFEAIAQHATVLGKTGSGKSSVLRRLVESLLDDQRPVCIVDPKGDWWGLKSSQDGKRAGYPVVIFGGEHADVVINAHSGAAVADLIATGNRPCIIDLGGWTVADRTRFFIAFAETMFRMSRGPRWLVLDEVHNFAPQGKILDPDAGKMLHWANRLASEGRGKGITILSASQRPQKVHKDFLTCNETLIAMRVIHSLDRAAMEDWIEGYDAAKGREVLTTLAHMKRGEAWVWSPEIGLGPVRMQFPLFKTFDSFRPQVAEVKLSGWAQVDLEEVKTKLAAAIEQAKANDPAELKRQIVDLRRQLASKPTVTAEKVVEKMVEVPVISGDQMTALQDGIASGTLLADRITNAVLSIKDAMHMWRSKMHPVRAVVPAGGEAMRPSSNPSAALESGRGMAVGQSGLRRMLIAMAQRPQGLTASQLGVRAGMSSSSGTFDTYLSRGRKEGWMEGDRSQLKITAAGLRTLGAFEPLPVGRELLRYWLGELGSSGAARMLQALAEAYPSELTKEELGNRASISAGSGTFDTYLSRLRRLELIAGGNKSLRASDELFEGGGAE